LRHIRVASKQELKEPIMLGIKDVNRSSTRLDVREVLTVYPGAPLLERHWANA
jgi:hypothetical protein